MNKNNQQVIRVVASVLLVAGLTACGELKPDLTQKQIVEQRATERWEHLLAKNWFVAYEYATPGFRSSTPMDIYSVQLRSSPIKWHNAEVKTASCESEAKCVVLVDVDFSANGLLRGADNISGTEEVEETWLLLENNWYHVEE